MLINAGFKYTIILLALENIYDNLGHHILNGHSELQRKDGSGEIVLEYYSRDEFERLIELFEIINKNYN